MPVYTSSIEVTADYPTIKPSLNLNFARSRSLDPRITFTRASVGTYVGRDGLVKTAGEDEPRFDHDPDTLESLGLLLEESRTNSLPYSSSIIGNVNWSGAGVAAIAATSITAPDGSTDTVALRDDGSNGQHTLYDDISVSNITSTYTASCWVKAGTQNYAELFSNGGGTAGTITIGYKYDLVNKTTSYTGTVGFDTGTSATITEYPNGWFRITMTGDVADTATGAGTYRLHIRARTDVSGNYQGDNTDGIYIWGAQVEAGSFPTSYIPTSGSAVTRAVDVAFVSAKAFAEIYNPEESTVLMDVRANMPVSVGNQRNMFHLGNDNNDGFGFFKEGGGLNKFFHIRSGGGTLANFDSGVDFPYQTTVKFAAAFTSGDQAVYFDNVLRTSTTDTSGLNQSAITIWNIGASNSQGANPLTGTISKMVYYPKRVSNAQLLTLRDS